MNQELKFKWHSVYGQILFDRKLKTAWEKVKSNNGAGGIDGETVQSYKSNEDENLTQVTSKTKAEGISTLILYEENTFPKRMENFVH